MVINYEVIVWMLKILAIPLAGILGYCIVGAYMAYKGELDD